MHLERRPGGGYRVYYAIADVAAFVKPGSPLDAEAHDRIETLYFPDLKVPLHPPSISEGPASLLPNQVVPALLWQHDLDADGNVTDSTVSRAKVRSLAKLNYAGSNRTSKPARPRSPSPCCARSAGCGKLLKPRAAASR